MTDHTLPSNARRTLHKVDLTRDGEPGTEKFAEQARSMLMTGTPTHQEKPS